MLIEWNKTIADELPTNNAVAVLCVGSCEQHSYYLPTGTDTFLAEGLVKLAAKRTEKTVLFLPTISVGYSPHHRHFPGCITIGANTLINLVVDVCSSAFANGVSDLLIVNGHGGNQSALQNAVNELGANQGLHPMLVRYWDLISKEIQEMRDSQPGGMGHAGEFETSLMMWLHQELVDSNRISYQETAYCDEWYSPDLFASNSIYRYVPFEHFSEGGNIGQPHLASYEKGQRIGESIIKALGRLMDFGMQSLRL